MMRSLNGLALRNMGTARVRTILSVIIVLVGVSMMIATDGFTESMRAAMPGADEGQNIGSFVLGTIDILMTVSSLVIMLAASFLIFNAFMMSVTQRRQQIGMLRSIGMTRNQILRLVVMEGLAVGIIGTVIGLIAGPLLSYGLGVILKNVGGGMFTIDTTLTIHPATMLVAAATGIIVTLLAVLIPAWNATGVSPLAALRPPQTGNIEHSPRRRAYIAIFIMLALMIFLLINPPGKWVESPQGIQLTLLFSGIWLVCMLTLLPVIVEVTADFARRILSKRWKMTGRIMADNLQRERQRVTLTILTMALSMTMIIAMTGFSQFFLFKLVLDVMEERSERTLYGVLPFNMNDGIGAFTSSELELPDGLLDELYSKTDGLAAVAPIRIAFIPELASMFPDMFSYVMSPQEIQATGDFLFTFVEGDWETATPMMESGCGILVSPAVASRLDVEIGDTITLDSPNGDVTCTLAGIGTTPGTASIMSVAGSEPFEPTPPIEVAITPYVGVDDATVEVILFEIRDDYPGIYVENIGNIVTVMQTMTGGMAGAMNGILVIAVLAAALGILNTTMMSVQERQHEMGLLRAIGATRNQVRNMVMGEAALMGLVGALVGLVAGAGMTIIFVVTYGGNSVGLTDMPLWSTAFEVLQPALITGIVGLIVAPIIAAIAAYFPARNILKGAAIASRKRSA